MSHPTPALDAFSSQERKDLLQKLAATLPDTLEEMQPLHVNMHCHTFFSYNGYGASPSHIAWRARSTGWHAAGICDFDVLDAMDEFLQAGDLLRLRTAAFMETRAFFKEYGDKVINSPGEPGVFYFMGAGFVAPPAEGSPAAEQLQAMRSGAEARNRDMIDRINATLAPLVLDYEHDVLPLTPSGNATERHICTAYYEKSRSTFHRKPDWTAFWSDKLGIDHGKAEALYATPMDFNDTCRSKLMKAGGPGYVSPTPETFPALDDVISMIKACDAIPMGAWLDGVSEGEADIRGQLECLMGKGIEALNIIPDRNWNIRNAEERALKVAKLHEYVAIAQELGLPLNVGTELNKFGQPWIDDFTADAMLPIADAFIEGARVMVGHTRLLRFAGVSYISTKAKSDFPDRHERNRIFAATGALPAPSQAMLTSLKEADNATNYTTLLDAAKKGHWPA